MKKSEVVKNRKAFEIACKTLHGGENHRFLNETEGGVLIEATYSDQPWMMRHIVRELTDADLFKAWEILEARDEDKHEG